jgi:hypothetical protein
MRGIEVRFCLPLNFPGKFRRRQKISLSSNFPSSSMQGKLEDREIFCFQLNLPGKFRRQKRMHRGMREIRDLQFSFQNNENRGDHGIININYNYKTK